MKLGGYGPVLSQPKFRWFWIGQTVSSLGDAVARIAVLLAVARSTDSPFALTLALVVPALPAVLLGPALGVLVDRVDRRAAMVWANVASTTLLIAMAFSTRSIPALLVLSGLLSVVASFFNPARTALMAEVTGEEHYLSAASLSEGAYMVMSLAGPAVGGLLTGLAGPRASFLFDAVSFIVSAVSLGLMGSVARREAAPRRKASFGGDFRDGLRTIAKTPALSFTMVLFVAIVLVFGGVTVLMADYVCHVIAATDAQYGLVESCLMAGVIATTLATGYAGRRLRKGQLIVGSTLAMGVVTLIFFTGPRLPVVLAWALALGAADGLTNGPVSAIMVENTPPDRRGRVMATYAAVMRGGNLIGAPLAGLAAAALGSGPVLGIMGAVLTVVGVVSRLHPAYHSVDARSAQPDSAAPAISA